MTSRDVKVCHDGAVAKPAIISDEIHDELARMQAEGASWRDLSLHLRSKHGMKISHETIRRQFGERRLQRREALQSVVIRKLLPAVSADLDRLGEIQEEVRAMAVKVEADLETAKEIRDRMMIVNTWRALKSDEAARVEQRLRHAGVEPTEAPPASIASLSPEEQTQKIDIAIGRLQRMRAGLLLPEKETEHEEA